MLHTMWLHHGHEVSVSSLEDGCLMAWSEVGQDETEWEDVNLVGHIDEIEGLEEYQVCGGCWESMPHEYEECRSRGCESGAYLRALKKGD